MRYMLLMVAAAVLGACSTAPMSEGERQATLAYLNSRANQPAPPQPQPYMVPIPRQTTCTSTPMGNSVQTTCN